MRSNHDAVRRQYDANAVVTYARFRSGCRVVHSTSCYDGQNLIVVTMPTGRLVALPVHFDKMHLVQRDPLSSSHGNAKISFQLQI